MSDKIFYSWQSDLPNRTNRGLIQSALEKAAKDIRSDDSIAIDPVVDRDTLGEPGAPDIAATILRKIEVATAFVCDVSIVCRPVNGRPCPNPNVMLELGYALKSISSDRVILVFNTAYGDVSELPFDLRFKRVMTYRMSDDAEPPGHVRKLLRTTFKDALQGIFEHLEKISKDKEEGAYLTSLNQVLTKIILFGEESRQREINPWAQEVVDTFESAAGEVRELAAEEVSSSIEIFDDLETLADQLDKVVDFPKALGRESWDNFNTLVDEAVGTAWQIKMHHIDSVRLADNYRQEVSKLMGQKIRILSQWVARYERTDDNMRYRIFEDLLSNVAETGYVLLQISYYKLDKIKSQFAEVLRREAMLLHLVEYRYEMSGNTGENEFVEEIKNRISVVESLMEDII